ncbi:hypothetical protein VR41_01960 [Streptomyces sp. NRRL B-1568]|nr:hypothetical protein VR41_01960 [Streptomyces sp. NRRL B-1568]
MTTHLAHWLAQASPNPRATTAHWESGRTAPLLNGHRWDLVQLDFTLATVVVTHLKAHGHHIGPYLMSGAQRTMWWLLPLGTGYRLAGIRGVTVCPTDWPLLAPPPAKYLGDRVWVLPEPLAPGRRPGLTAPDDLRAALDAAHHRLAGKLAGKVAAPCP